jgi:hypothetical protein
MVNVAGSVGIATIQITGWREIGLRRTPSGAVLLSHTEARR